MPRKRHSAEEIVTKLRQVDVLSSQGRPVAEAIRSISIITSLPARPAKALLDKAGITEHFSLIDTFGSRRYRKPSPRLLVLHLDALGVLPNEAVYVGDSEGDMRMASAAGATALGVGWSRSSPDAFTRADAKGILDSLEQLADVGWMAGIFASPIPRPC